MARKLKTFQTSLGFYDLAIAAPSMKAALEAWGAASNLFHQGVAKETDDPDVVAATMDFERDARARPELVAQYIADPQARQVIAALAGYISDGTEALTCAQMVPLFGYYF